MMFKKATIALAAMALVAAPAIAQVSPALAPLSGDESALGEGGAVFLGLAATALVIGGIIAASDSSDTDLPVSP
jgi:hypothetical protein